MPALAIFLPYIFKYVLPAVVVVGIITFVYIKYNINRRKELEDKMRKDKEVSENQISQLNSVQKVEEDMACESTQRPSFSSTEKRMEDGTF